jgi:hypothetical protein
MDIISTVHPSGTDAYKIFPLDHNWSSVFRVSYEYKTDIITSGNGKEQRSAVRWMPRRTFEFSCRYRDATEKQLLDQFMAKVQPNLCYVPEENCVVHTTSFFDAEATGITFNGVKAEWMKEGRVVILSNGWRKETRSIVGAGDGSITFGEFNETTFPAGTKVCAASLARLDLQPNASRLTSTKGTIAVKADVDPGSEIWDAEDLEDDDIFIIGLREYFDHRNNWGAPPDIEYVYPRELIDYGYGPVSAYLPFSYPARIHKTTYLAKTAVAASSYVKFFMRHLGRNREFLAQTFEPDVPYYAVAAGSKSLLIEGRNFGLAYRDTTVFRRIVIRPIHGEPVHRQVDFIEVLPDTETTVVWLTEDLPDDVNLAPAEIYGCSWVLVSRFASDRLEVDWQTNEVAVLALSMQSLENFDI